MLRQNPYGPAGAGVLFTCEDDGTVLLFLRSGLVEEPYTWGIIGGAVGEEAFFDLPIPEYLQVPPESKLFEKQVEIEIIEECGSLPPDFSKEVLRKNYIDYTNQGFRYRDFIYNLSLQDKEEWTSKIKLNWENDDFAWLGLEELDALGSEGELHFGVQFILENM